MVGGQAQWPLRLATPDGTAELLLRGVATGVTVTEDGGLCFGLPVGQHAYLHSGGRGGLSRPPAEADLPLRPGLDHQLLADVELDGGTVTLWLIEYAADQRVGQHRWPLTTGRMRRALRTREDADGWRLAVRLSGTGRLAVSGLDLRAHAQPSGEHVVTGVRGGFRRRSEFMDPAGHRPLTDRHHGHYEGREPDWYRAVLARIGVARSVLDLGCGPGLLMAALTEAGTKRVVGLERDPMFVTSARARGLDVVTHDLNEPFPFVASGSFDAVVVHHVLDYLAPIGARTALREARRVLRPGGLLLVQARTDGPGSGDRARPVALSPDLLRRLFDEAGFPEVELSGGRSVAAVAHRLRDGALVAEAGVSDPAHALRRTLRLAGETQCTVAVRARSRGPGGVTITLRGGGLEASVPVEPDGAAAAACVRVVRPASEAPEWTVSTWRNGEPIDARHERLGFAPVELELAVAVPPDGAPVEVDHVDVWTPAPLPVDGFGDAHMYAGRPRAVDPLLPDVSVEALLGLVDERRIGRALLVPYGPRRPLDTFDELAEAAARRQGTMHPLIRLPPPPGEGEAAVDYLVAQLEALWQHGALWGLKIHLGVEGPPPRRVLDWAEHRDAITLWHAASMEHLDWLAEEVLAVRPGLPALLSHFGGYPLDRRRYQRAIELMDAHPGLHLVSSVVFFAPYLAEAAGRHPDRVLVGSDYPAVDPDVARTAIERLDLDEHTRSLVLGENLRHLAARVEWRRSSALATGDDLRFPALPLTAEDVARQGFHVVSPSALPASEAEDAKRFWARYEVKPWYRATRPYAVALSEVIRDLAPRSVLEFGCNVGRNLGLVADRLDEVEVTGLDVNEEAVRLGREATGLDLRVGDEGVLATLPDGAFDLVFTLSVLDHIPDIDAITSDLVRCAARHAVFLEVTLPVEGRVERHLDHRSGAIEASTRASYSWDVARRLRRERRAWRVDERPVYLHGSALGPYYRLSIAYLE